jgi:hypothetical protein
MNGDEKASLTISRQYGSVSRPFQYFHPPTSLQVRMLGTRMRGTRYHVVSSLTFYEMGGDQTVTKQGSHRQCVLVGQETNGYESGITREQDTIEYG